MHVRLPQSLISMSIQKLYTNRSSFAQSARFSRPGASLSIIAKVIQEKITLYLHRATVSRSSSLYLSFWNTNYQYQFIDLRKRTVFKLKKIEIRKNMTESQEKPLATWLMENIVKGDGSEYLDFEEISSKLTSILPKKKVGTISLKTFQ